MNHNYKLFDRVKIHGVTHIIGSTLDNHWRTMCLQYAEPHDRIYPDQASHGTGHWPTCVGCVTEEPKWKKGLPSISEGAVKSHDPKWAWLLGLPRH